MADRLESLLKILEVDAKDTFTRYAISLEYISKKRYGDAIQNLEFIVENDKDYLAAYQQLGQIFAITGNKPKAIEIYKQGVEIALKIKDGHAASNLKSLIDQLS
jgi:tetratricopeptide (TPR) repeat protein